MTEQLAKAESHPLDFKAKKRRTSKKPYIFSFGFAKSCTHPTLKEVVQGSNKYRCERCNYDFWLPSATMWPAHWGWIMSAFELMKGVKDFGLESVNEVLHQKIGQYDHKEQKPVLPEGKSLMDVLHDMDDVDVEALAGEVLPRLMEGSQNGRSSDDQEDEDDTDVSCM